MEPKGEGFRRTPGQKGREDLALAIAQRAFQGLRAVEAPRIAGAIALEEGGGIRALQVKQGKMF
jgi:hypothetical protein